MQTQKNKIENEVKMKKEEVALNGKVQDWTTVVVCLQLNLLFMYFNESCALFR